ncbi:serine/threonine protein kinase [Polytolypa hystricis UAMH7299]|uniref:Serine/threonine protein kinase n=1 Tax=Polytolypa hystricis (strain UAMH7299) TaxID=1447883 RepID=A0A2B7XSR0_POLH7|nr:serine/threonine protein kinase [Polytolypa hystricis UAMH7299]
MLILRRTVFFMVYRRLRNCDGVVRCFGFGFPGDCIQMELMENGDLSTYLKGQRPVQSVQLSWFRQMAHALLRIHDRCIIGADIAAKNFLLSADLSIKFCDFTESSILPLGTNMERADDHGYSIYIDIGQLGAVLYEVITGQRCEFDLFKDQPAGPACAAWPRREILPSTQNIWLGSIIEKCWTKGAFRNARSLLAALELQLNWMREAAAAVSHALSKRVLIGGFTARNFLIADKQTFKLCYIANSRIVPEYLDIDKVDQDGLSVKCDIACFGSLVYNVATGRKFEVPSQLSNPAALGSGEGVVVSGIKDYMIPGQIDEDRYDPFPGWPQNEDLPNTAGIFMGEIIRNYWDQDGYQRMEEVCGALSKLSECDRSSLVWSSTAGGDFICRSLQ